MGSIRTNKDATLSGLLFQLINARPQGSGEAPQPWAEIHERFQRSGLCLSTARHNYLREKQLGELCDVIEMLSLIM
ncbi:MAG TPA: hypothetical protein VJM12_18510 [Pyrinomonadaceae bacterium]|nr:hypothetical protein [Pyrinomonadaceae bacterium]